MYKENNFTSAQLLNPKWGGLIYYQDGHMKYSTTYHIVILWSSTCIIAECLSARHLIVQYNLDLRLYMYICPSRLGMQSTVASLARMEFPVRGRLEFELYRRCIA